MVWSCHALSHVSILFVIVIALSSRNTYNTWQRSYHWSPTHYSAQICSNFTNFPFSTLALGESDAPTLSPQPTPPPPPPLSWNGFDLVIFANVDVFSFHLLSQYHAVIHNSHDIEIARETYFRIDSLWIYAIKRCHSSIGDCYFNNSLRCTACILLV